MLFNVISSKMLPQNYLKCEKWKERKMSFNTGTLSINIVLLRTSVQIFGIHSWENNFGVFRLINVITKNVPTTTIIDC